MKTEKLRWCGPSGHTSPLCGDLTPGRLYDIPEEHVAYFLTQKGYWASASLPDPKPSRRKSAEKE